MKSWQIWLSLDMMIGLVVPCTESDCQDHRPTVVQYVTVIARGLSASDGLRCWVMDGIEADKVDQISQGRQPRCSSHEGHIFYTTDMTIHDS